MKKPLKTTLRFAVLNRDAYTCRYCGRSAPTVKLQVDHIVPTAAGGTDSIDNLITSCADCNRGKSDKPLVTPESIKQLPTIKDLIMNRSLGEWAIRNIVLGDIPFSFQGHEYLKEPYSSQHPYIVFEKASQMGLSVLALCKAIWACETFGMTVIYWFPTDGDVLDFSQGRFQKIVDDSPYLQTLMGVVKGKRTVDKVKLKEIGKGHLYFRGLFHSQKGKQGRSGGKTKSVDADFLVFDELDEAQPKQKEAALHRVDHSKYKWVMELSTPTIPDYGIDIEFQRSDQRYWNIKCPHHGCRFEHNILEETFPDCLKRVSQEKVIRICQKCKQELDVSQGIWIPKRPEIERKRGYHISQLYSTYVDPVEVLDDFEDPKKDLTFFYNHRLGKPYLDASDRLTKQEALNCCDPSIPWKEDGERCSMGVDVQKREFYVCITERFGVRQRVVFLDRVPVSINPEDESFAALIPLIERYNVACCVIDAQPETHEARKFANKFKQRVYLCYTPDQQKEDLVWTDADIDGVGRVSAVRTESFDATMREIRRGGIVIPRQNRMVEMFADHCYNLVRTRQEDPETNAIKFKYIAVGDDHFAQARNYCRIAESKMGKIGDIKQINKLYEQQHKYNAGGPNLWRQNGM